MKTIGKCGAACVAWLKSCVFLKRKLALFFGNLCMICMLWKFFELNLPVNFLYFLSNLFSFKLSNLVDISTSCEKLRAFERNLSL